MSIISFILITLKHRSILFVNYINCTRFFFNKLSVEDLREIWKKKIVISHNHTLNNIFFANNYITIHYNISKYFVTPNSDNKFLISKNSFHFNINRQKEKSILKNSITTNHKNNFFSIVDRKLNHKIKKGRRKKKKI